MKKSYLYFLLTLYSCAGISQDSYVPSLFEANLEQSKELGEFQSRYIYAVSSDDVDLAGKMTYQLRDQNFYSEFPLNKVVAFSQSADEETFVLFEEYVVITRLLRFSNELFVSCALLNKSLANSQMAIESSDMKVKKFTIESINASWISVATAKTSLERLLSENKNDKAVIKTRGLFDRILLEVERMNIGCFKGGLSIDEIATSSIANNRINQLSNCAKDREVFEISRSLTENLNRLFSENFYALNAAAGFKLRILE